MLSREDLRVQIMRAKYKCGDDMLPIIDTNRAGSNLWKGICNSWVKVQQNLWRTIGDGAQIQFWNHSWIPEGGKLGDVALTTVSARLSSNLVSHYVDDQGRLELQFLQSMHSGFFAKVDGRHWDQVFAVALNNLWWWRNKTIFENYQLQPDAVAIQILAKTDGISESIQ